MNIYMGLMKMENLDVLSKSGMSFDNFLYLLDCGIELYLCRKEKRYWISHASDNFIFTRNDGSSQIFPNISQLINNATLENGEKLLDIWHDFDDIVG